MEGLDPQLKLAVPQDIPQHSNGGHQELELPCVKQKTRFYQPAHGLQSVPPHTQHPPPGYGNVVKERGSIRYVASRAGFLQHLMHGILKARGGSVKSKCHAFETEQPVLSDDAYVVEAFGGDGDIVEPCLNV